MSKSQAEINKEIALETAKARGYNSTSDMMGEIRAQLNSDNPQTRALGEEAARGTVEQLLALCLKQVFMVESLPAMYQDLVGRTNDGVMHAGNTKAYDVKNPTGITTYERTAFIPTGLPTKDIDQFALNMYSNPATKKLSKWAYKFMKQQTLEVQEWLPFFKEGTLNTFISQLQKELQDVYTLYMYAKVCEIITSESNTDSDTTQKISGKIVNGTANNLFEAWIEVLYHFNFMTQYNKDYNADQSNPHMYAAEPDDLLIFVSNKVLTTTRNGILSQTYNAQIMGAESKQLKPENLRTLGKKILISENSENTVLTNSPDEWIDDNTIIIVDISRIKHLVQFDQAGAQFFQKNVVNYISKNVWGAIAMLPWCKKLIYKNNNLTIAPTQVVK